MRYKFQDILNENIYKDCRVMFSVGKYNLFNDLVSGTLKGLCIDNKVKLDLSNVDVDFTENDIETEELSNNEEVYVSSLNLDDFFMVAHQPCLEGKWYCRASLSSLSSKQKEKMMNYLKAPSDTAILVLTSTEFKEYVEFLKNKLITSSRYVHMIQLSYPSKRELSKIIENMLANKELKASKDAIELFKLKMSTEYDLYVETIDLIHDRAMSELRIEIDIDSMKDYLRDVEHFNLDDLIYEIVKPITSKKNATRKVRVLHYLQEKYEPENLAYQLLKYVEKMITYRILINKGYIPVNIKYIFNDVIKKIIEMEQYNKKFKGINEWLFRKEAESASKTTLKDWMYMKLILKNALSFGFKDSKERRQACERALYDIVIRSKLNENRLNNIIGISDILGTQSLEILDRVMINKV